MKHYQLWHHLLIRTFAALPLFVPAFAILTSCYSCTHVYYAPNTAHAPLLTVKGETRVNALYSTGQLSGFSGGEAQVARALSTNVGAMVNYFSAGKEETISDGSNTTTSHVEKGHGTYLEIAGGYFNRLDAKKKWIAELYAGYGFGSTTNDYGHGNHSRVAVGKYFLQPAIGFKTKNVEVAFIPKFSWINWKVKGAAISSSFVWPLFDELNAIDKRPNFMAFEPAFLLRFGTSGIKFQSCLSFSNGKGRSLLLAGSLYENFMGSIGVSVRLLPQKK